FALLGPEGARHEAALAVQRAGAPAREGELVPQALAHGPLRPGGLRIARARLGAVLALERRAPDGRLRSGERREDGEAQQGQGAAKREAGVLHGIPHYWRPGSGSTVFETLLLAARLL